MIEWVILAVAAAILGGSAAVALSVRIKRFIANWLQAHGLQQHQLMDALVRLDNIGSAVKLTFWLTTAHATVVEISNETIPLSEIDDPEVRQALIGRGFAELSAMPYLEH